MIRGVTSAICIVLLGGVLMLLSFPASARDDVPEETAKKKSPVSLAPEKARYYARQYKARCARCHGKEGDGGGAEAEEQAVPPRNFTDAAYMESRTDGQLFYQILAGGGERCAMPAFGPTSDAGWSEEKIWYMVEFVRRFSRPQGK